MASIMTIAEMGGAPKKENKSCRTGEDDDPRLLDARGAGAYVDAAGRGSDQQHGGLDFTALNRVHVPVALLSFVLLPLLLLAGRKRPELGPLTMLAATVLLALLVNAVVCGALSNPHNRYGARLIWLAPLVITLVLRGAGRENQGKAIGLRGTANRVASILSPLAMGAIAEAVGLERSFYVVGALASVVMIGIAIYLWRNPQIAKAGEE